MTTGRSLNVPINYILPTVLILKYTCLSFVHITNKLYIANVLDVYKATKYGLKMTNGLTQRTLALIKGPLIKSLNPAEPLRTWIHRPLHRRR